MTRRVRADMIEKIVGVERHEFRHIFKVEDGEVHILHSAVCRDTTPDLRDCVFSQELDNGLSGDWPEGEPTFAQITEDGRLVPWSSEWAPL